MTNAVSTRKKGDEVSTQEEGCIVRVIKKRDSWREEEYTHTHTHTTL
jgi:hypothetical protein